MPTIAGLATREWPRVCCFSRMVLRPIIFALFAWSAYAQVDHSRYWGEARHQGRVGACHVFAAVALLEGEHAAQFGQRVNFSEALVFGRHFLGTGNEEMATRRLHNILRAVALFSGNSTWGWEGGRIHSSFALAQDLPVLEEAGPSYRDVEELTGHVNRATQQVRQQRNQGTGFEEVVDGTLPVLLRATETQRQSLLTDYPLARTGWGTALSYTKREREEVETDLREFLIRKLACRPVGVEAAGDIWSSGATGGHSVVVVGHDPRRRQFIVRNSWGRAGLFNSHERVDEDELVEGITAIGWVENPAMECYPAVRIPNGRSQARR